MQTLFAKQLQKEDVLNKLLRFWDITTLVCNIFIYSASTALETQKLRPSVGWYL